ncbi:hypothetical protein [Umezawaea sp. Da 62-37]|uniref:hypothetical protein n=1 Tax=Umezawaea sp. Da 62-37 TaxID=3075927 RepID=UPI0028F6CA37|nr:hypothetical protein [Umezawaea sp. Da 62-37]WNV87179.1 hypothetical protein RM788_02470 [Umezawaea sp. Da 62-37]
MHVNWSALGEVLLVALTAGVGVVALFSSGIVALDRRTTARADRRPAGVATATSALCFLACAAVVVYGLYLVVVR